MPGYEPIRANEPRNAPLERARQPRCLLLPTPKRPLTRLPDASRRTVGTDAELGLVPLDEAPRARRPCHNGLNHRRHAGDHRRIGPDQRPHGQIRCRHGRKRRITMGGMKDPCGGTTSTRAPTSSARVRTTIPSSDPSAACTGALERIDVGANRAPRGGTHRTQTRGNARTYLVRGLPEGRVTRYGR